MNASLFLLLLLLFLFLLSTCHGEEQDDSRASGILATTKGQKKLETPLEASCPEAVDIEPCECSNQGLFFMDCSKVQDEAQLREVFSAFFPITDFYRFHMSGNKGLRVLEDRVFGDVTFQELDIQEGVLETVRNDALAPSLSILTSIQINSSQLAIFPFEKLAEFTSLRTLSLGSNEIHSLPPLASSSLQSLDLSLNAISYLSPDVFTLLTAAEQIHLNGNHLTEITPGTFRGLPKLFNLILTGNKISYLQSLTFDLAASPSRRGYLDLVNNNIDFVEMDAFKGVRDPSSINLTNNSLSSLEERVWKPVLEKGITVILEGNALSCGCDVAWVVRDPQLLTAAQYARCADGTLLTDLDPADFDICD